MQAKSTAADRPNFTAIGLPGCHQMSVSTSSPATAIKIPTITFHCSNPCSKGLRAAVNESPEILTSQEFPPAAKSSTQEPSVQASANNAAVDALSLTVAAKSEIAITSKPYRKCPNSRHSVSGV